MSISRPNLPMLLLRVRELVIAEFRPIFKRHGVTEQQWRILRVLFAEGPMEPRELVVRCGLSSPSLTGILARMSELGLVTRTRLGHDQRRVQIATTAASQALVVQIAPAVEQVYARMDERLGDGLSRRLLASLDEVIEVLGARPVVDDCLKTED